MKNLMFAALAVIGSAALVSTTPAQADPATPMPVIESSAAQLCRAVDADPTPSGVTDGLTGLRGRHLDEIDGALVIVTAVHHVCPQHEELFMSAMTSAVEGDICNRRL